MTYFSMVVTCTFKRMVVFLLELSQPNKRINNPDLKITMIYNLFSNYGNIAKILFMKQKRQALVEFETVEQATVAKDYLNNLVYFAS
jgi:RNA recognition motif. (a.k.a. RRM, RBD, or RNP domain)